MSRHRNFQGINQKYEEWDDGGDYDEDDCAGSYHDGYGVSPSTTAEFTLNKINRGNRSLADFIGPDEEDDDSNDQLSNLSRNSSYSKPPLTDEQEAMLASCLDHVRNVVGETFPESVIVQTSVECGFDGEKTLDTLLKGNQANAVKESTIRDPQPMPKAVVNKKTEVPDTSPRKQSESVKESTKQPVRFDIGDGISDLTLTETPAHSGFGTHEELDKKDKKPPSVPVNKSIKSLIDSESGRSSPSLSRSSSKSKLERLDGLAEYEKRQQEGKPLINLIVIGHVDAGKSTLMGHLLYQAGYVSQKQMHRYELDSKKLGKASFMYAWVLDETEEERTRGVTMDIAQTRFETEKRIVNLMDAPGHKDFIPNMITGAAQADCALLVVNATNGEFETGFESGGQTREHTLLVRSLGVQQLIVVVNKMDTVSWSQQRFLEIGNKLSIFLKQAGFKDSEVRYVPCSGLSGINLTTKPEQLPEFRWYTGESLLREIDKFEPPPRLVAKPLRACVQDIYKGQGQAFSVGVRVDAGDIQNNDRVLVLPAMETAFVKAICINEGQEKIAFAGDCVTLQLTGIDIQKVQIGTFLCDPANPMPIATKFKAQIVIFNIELPLTKGSPVVYHAQSLNEPAVISRLLEHRSNQGKLLKVRPRCLTKNSSALVEITLSRPLCIEVFNDFKDLGRFMLRSEGHTIAAGKIMEILNK